MALYIDSAFLHDITEVAKTVPLAGVTMNPSILLAARERGQRLEPQDLLPELLRCQDGMVFMQSGATDEEGMYAQALSYVQVDAARVTPKIPTTHVGMRVALRLKAQGCRFAMTAVTSVAQAYTAALAGADFIIPYYNRLERCGIDASGRVSKMAQLLRNQQLSTRIMASSIKTSVEAASALMSGAHDLTVPTQVLLEMLTDELTEQAVEKFSQDWQKMKRM